VIELQKLRTAFDSERPDEAIDALIRVELASGRTTAQIYEALADLLPILAEWPECAGDAEEALNGALQALTGRGAPANRYRDQPISAMPVSRFEEPIASLQANRMGPI